MVVVRVVMVVLLVVVILVAVSWDKVWDLGLTCTSQEGGALLYDGTILKVTDPRTSRCKTEKQNKTIVTFLSLAELDNDWGDYNSLGFFWYKLRARAESYYADATFISITLILWFTF